MDRGYLLKFIFIIPVLILTSCSHQPAVVDYPPLDWSINAQRLKATGCTGKLQETCPRLYRLGCDEINPPKFYLGGLQPPYAVMECIHAGSEPFESAYFKQLPGLDTRYRSYVIDQNGEYSLLINKSKFKEIFAPVESADEAISYAMAMTSLGARFDIDPGANVEYLVDKIEETHAEEIPGGYRVYLFDWSHKMGCDTHSFYAVKVLVTRDGSVHEEERTEIYRSYACFDFEALALNDN